MRTKGRKKKISRLRIILPEAKAPNEHWSMDFMSKPGSGTTFLVRLPFARNSDQRVKESPLLG
jgi:hypothetical protein